MNEAAEGVVLQRDAERRRQREQEQGRLEQESVAAQVCVGVFTFVCSQISVLCVRALEWHAR